MTVREAALARRLRYPLAFAAAAAGTAWSAWYGPPGNAATTINRVDVITMVVILAALPWIVGRTRGTVSRAGWRGWCAPGATPRYSLWSWSGRP